MYDHCCTSISIPLTLTHTSPHHQLPIHPHAPKHTQSLVQNIVRSTLSLTFVIALVRVVYNIKGRMFREMAWQLEVKGDVTRQRRVEAIDKLMSVLTLIVGAVFGFQALGLDSM